MQYRLITFDVFSALGDIQGTFIPLLKSVKELDGKDANLFFQTWRSKQYEYMIVHNSLERSFMSFEEVTRRTLDHTLHINNVHLAKADKETLVAGWRRINFWDEAKEVVQEVKERGYLIGMLSNGDHEILTELEEHFGVSFDYIFSAEQIGCYKPSPKVYDFAYEHVGIEKTELLHVAGSTIDILGAISSGIPCAWSNRQNQVPLDLTFKPTYNLQNLKGVLSHI